MNTIGFYNIHFQARFQRPLTILAPLFTDVKIQSLRMVLHDARLFHLDQVIKPFYL